MKHRLLVCGLGVWAWVAGAWPLAHAQTSQEAESADAPPAVKSYLLGASLGSSTAHLGLNGSKWDLQPVYAFQVGRYRLASGRASALLSVGRETVDAGVSTSLMSHDRWSLGVALHMDSGRKPSADDPLLVGLPGVRDTLRGRASVAYALGPRWSWGATVSQDLLGREGGAQWSTRLAYRHPVSTDVYWDVSLSVSGGNRTYMQTQYGIAPAAAAATGRAAYIPHAGWEGVQLGWSLTAALSDEWVAFGGIGLSQLQGDAGRSPLVGRRTVGGVNVGLAYRCCR